MRYYLALFFVCVLAGCAAVQQPDKTTIPLVLKPASFSDLPGWTADNQAQALPAMRKTCERIFKKSATQNFGILPEAGAYGDWQVICQELLLLPPENLPVVRAFFESRFQPYLATAAGDPKGLFTGYYEASLRGSRTRQGAYQYPLYARPDDLVMVNLGEFRDELKGQRIAGRVMDGNLKPYEDRAEIVAGRWPHNDKALVWIDNAVDAFFVQVQGSGVVRLDDGSVMRIGYAGQNGHIYYAIGRELIKRGALTKDNVSMQAIREWLAANPEQADDVMNTNRSYVFFRELLSDGPVGGEGVTLTARRSLAIDHSKIPYGVPVWLQTDDPALQRLMVAQDTGGAIRGAVRGDVFWGYGPEAEKMAGPMKASGQYWLLLPKTIAEGKN